jgi:ribonuclease PH
MPLSNALAPQVLMGAEAKTQNAGDNKERIAESLECSVGHVCGASGSSMVTEGGAKALCTVSGPQTSQKSQGKLDAATLEVEVRYAPLVAPPTYSTTCGAALKGLSLDGTSAAPTSASGQPNASVERVLCESLRGALEGMVRLERYPKMVITVRVTLLESSGNVGQDLAATITGSSLALGDAEVEQSDLVTASTASLVHTPAAAGTMDAVEGAPARGQAAAACVTVCSRCNAPEMTQLWMEGRVAPQKVFLLVEKAVRANTAKAPLLQAALRDKLMRAAASE